MNDLRSQFSSLGFNPGYYDLLVMDRNVSLEPDFNFNFATLDYNKILNVENLEFTFSQDATNFTRLAGEGADPKQPTVVLVVEKGLIGFGKVGTPTLLGIIIGLIAHNGNAVPQVPTLVPTQSSKVVVDAVVPVEYALI
jgi:hypothetical protein